MVHRGHTFLTVPLIGLVSAPLINVHLYGSPFYFHKFTIHFYQAKSIFICVYIGFILKKFSYSLKIESYLSVLIFSCQRTNANFFIACITTTLIKVLWVIIKKEQICSSNAN